MGVLANTKQFLANKITNVAHKTADGIASSSALSPKQMLDIEKKRMEYLSAKPDMDDENLFRETWGQSELMYIKLIWSSLKSYINL